MKKNTTLALKIATIGFLTLSMGIILFPIQRTPIIQETQFVRNIQQLNPTQSHGAASQRDYLFEDETTTTTTTTTTQSTITGTSTTTPIYGGQLWTGTTTPTTVNTTIQTTNNSNLLNAMQQGLEQGITTPTHGNTMTPEALPGITCTTPRGQAIADKDFVLAYEQRKDVSSMCNVERRICNNGTLEWSYTQNACKENISYEYTKAEVISYNEPVINPLVQPSDPSNAGGDFGTNGQVNQVKTPTTMRWSSNTAGTTTSTATNQTITYKENCITPRGTTVNHGQFVKAYKTSVGLLDMPCETQLRLCVNGTLKGTFLNKSCTFKNITYNDYMAGNRDFTTPTPQDILWTLVTTENETENFGIWDRIKWVFK